MIKVLYAPSFIRQLQTEPVAFQEEVIEKIELFKNPKNHKSLKVHKLKGRLKDRYSFSVDYKNRIVFKYHNPKNTVILLGVGDHDVYDV